MNKIIWTEEKKEKAIQMLTEYFEKYGTGEQIMQYDDALIEAPELLSDIVDKVLIDDEGFYNLWEDTELTSEKWQELFKDMITVYDPDGWDRKNYQYSWFEEEITFKEFQDRVMRSTVIGNLNKDFFNIELEF